MRVSGQELARPDVVLGGAHRNQRRPLGGHADLAKIIIEAADRFLGKLVAQDGPVEIGVQGLEIQRSQHRLCGAAEVDANLVVHVVERSARHSRASRWCDVRFAVDTPVVRSKEAR